MKTKTKAVIKEVLPPVDIDLSVGAMINENEVYDVLDIASANEYGFTQQAIANQRKYVEESLANPDFDGVHCVDCESEIPKKRLVLRVIRCVDCQNYFEKQQKLYHK